MTFIEEDLKKMVCGALRLCGRLWTSDERKLIIVLPVFSYMQQKGGYYFFACDMIREHITHTGSYFLQMCDNCLETKEIHLMQITEPYLLGY